MNNSPNQFLFARLLALALAAAAALQSAHASITTYTDRNSFLAALGGASTTTETFSTNRAFVLGDNLYNGIDFRVTGTTVGSNSISGGILNGDEFTNTSIDYLFTAPIFALGADFTGAFTASGIRWVINGISTMIFNSNPGTGFFGIISTDPFNLVDVTGGPNPNEIYSLDNLTYASRTSAVPETGRSIALLALGMTGLVCLRRKLTSRTGS